MFPNLTLGGLASNRDMVFSTNLDILTDLSPIVSDIELTSKHVMRTLDPMVPH